MKRDLMKLGATVCVLLAMFSFGKAILQMISSLEYTSFSDFIDIYWLEYSLGFLFVIVAIALEETSDDA